MNDSEKFRGKYRTTSHRLKGYDYLSDGAYFITICTKNKEHFFGKIVNDEMVLNNLGKIAKNEWQKTAKIRENVIIDEFVVMPNHMHGIIFIKNNVEMPRWGISSEKMNYIQTPQRGVSTGNPNHKPQWKSGCIGAIINQFKSVCTKQIRNINPDFSWQPNYHDRIIRNEKELNRIHEYIMYNPQNWEKDGLYLL